MNENPRSLKLFIACVTSLWLVACGGGNASGSDDASGDQTSTADASTRKEAERVRRRDVTPPVVSITLPTTAGTYASAQPSVALAGTATDQVGVSSIGWANDRGGSGTVVTSGAGTAINWTVPSVPLLVGANTITVNAIDAKGNAGSRSVVVTYSTPSYALSVTRTGSGSVASTPAGIACATSACSASFAAGSSVSLAAVPATGYSFSGWGGACSGSAACTVTMNAAKSVTASFTAAPLASYALSATVVGSGTVGSTPAGISCSSGTCNASFAAATSVSLVATPAAGYSFSGWSGACGGTAACVVPMSAARSVTASFVATPLTSYALSTTVVGSGRVGSTPAGINCSVGTCSASFASGASVTLAATPAAGFGFSGWSGACTGTAACVVPMGSGKSVTASFTATAATAKSLTISISGSGGVGVSDGTTTSACTATCTKTFAANATVSLVAAASTDNVFAGWSGACGGAAACTVSMAGNVAVSAAFNATAATGKSYYVSTTGSDSAAGTSLTAPFKTITKALALVAPGDVVEVRAGSYNETLLPRNPGSASAWITLRGYNGERPIVRGSGAGPTMYFYRDECDEDAVGTGTGNTDCKAMYWIVQGLEIRGSAAGGGDGNAVKIDTPKVKLIGNRICCSVADVVKLVRTSNDVEIRGNEIWQDKAITVPSDNAQGIDIVGADRTIITGNHVHDVPDIGMYAKGNARNTVMENNLLVNIGGASNGHAMMLGQSTDFDRMVDGAYESYDGIVRNNVVVNSSWACVATASSLRVKIYNNSCYNTGSAVHGSILISNEAETGQAGQDIEIYNNIIYGSANNPVIKIASSAMTDYTTLKVDKNIYWIGGADPKFASSDQFSAVGSSAWRTNYKSLSGRTDSSLVIDPKYAGTTGTAALTLQATSPAINAGLTNAVVPTDRLGTARPQGGAYDIGAYEVLTGSASTSYALSVTIAGSGGVGLSSGGTTLSCTSNCSNSFPSGSVVSLAATPSTGYSFTGWSGACSGTGLCTVTTDAAKSASATFVVASSGSPPVVQTYDLAVTLAGTGGVGLSDGSTTASCSSNCTRTYSAGTSVALAAAPATNQAFAGWSGACGGTGGCTVSMSAAKSVSASFVPKYALSLTLAGSGVVGIANGTASTTCSTNCANTYASGSTLTLTALPATGFSFSGWAGACTGSGSCAVSMSAAKAVTASFVASAADTLAPAISAKSPAAGATGAAPAGPITVTFSEAMNCATLSSSSFTLSGVAGTVSCNGSQATFTPAVALAVNASYTAQVTTAAKDLAGNAMTGNTTWSFTTGTSSQFTFLAYGDSRSGNGCGGNTIHQNLVTRMVAEPAAFVFNLGDMVTGYDKSTNWVQRGDCPSDAAKGSFKEIIAPLQNKAPAAGLPTYYFPVVGNHDDNFGDGWYPDKFGNGFCDVFDPKKLIPNHTQSHAYFQDWTHANIAHYTDAEFYPLACAKTPQGVYPDYMYYSFDYMNSHFVVMRVNSDYHDLMECSNGCTDQSDYDKFYYKHQLDWLRYDLAQASAKPSIKNVFVLTHAPLITYADGHSANTSWPVLLKEFSKYNAKIVFSGHNHVYERSVPVYASDANPAGVRDDAKGTVYAITGGGGSDPHGFRTLGALNAKATNAYHYMRVSVDGTSISVKVIGQDGSVIDTFTR